MINLRYHIVSLTAVFLAIGIGLTLGSTFLDRATVENLNGQLENLEGRLEERNQEIEQLQGQLDQSETVRDALDEQGAVLLADRMDPVPVLVVASEGVDDEDVDGAVRALQTAGADVLGQWWLTERFLLGSDADIDDLAAALDETTVDPARLRRVAVDALGSELRAHQLELASIGTPGDTDGEGTTDSTDTTVDDGAGIGTTTTDPAATTDTTGAEQPAVVGPDAPGAHPVTDALVDAGFVTFEPVPDGPEEPTLAAGVRLVVVGGSPVVPDDVFVEPLVSRLARGTTVPTATVVTSALADDGAVSEVVTVVRENDRLRGLVSTVDSLDHFEGWVATVLAVEDLGERAIGHYGLGEGATALLPPLPAP